MTWEVRKEHALIVVIDADGVCTFNHVYILHFNRDLIFYNHFDLVQRDEGVKLVVESICAGIFNDLGSGSNVDVCVITKVSALMPNPTSCLRG